MIYIWFTWYIEMYVEDENDGNVRVTGCEGLELKGNLKRKKWLFSIHNSFS